MDLNSGMIRTTTNYLVFDGLNDENCIAEGGVYQGVILGGIVEYIKVFPNDLVQVNNLLTLADKIISCVQQYI
jgi:hypothetical protein